VIVNFHYEALQIGRKKLFFVNQFTTRNKTQLLRAFHAASCWWHIQLNLRVVHFTIFY